MFEKWLPFRLMGKVVARNLHRTDIPEDVHLTAHVCSARGGGLSCGKSTSQLMYVLPEVEDCLAVSLPLSSCMFRQRWRIVLR